MQPRVSHSLVQTLRGIPDFSTLDETTLLQIVGESMNLFWKAGSTIFEPGSHGDALYVVLSGEVAIYADDGQEVVHPKAGDFFGEMSILLEATHSRTAMAVSDTEILVLPKDAFKKLLGENPRLSSHFDSVVKTRQKIEVGSLED